MPMALYASTSRKLGFERMISTSPFNTLRATGRSLRSTATHLSSPMNGSSATGCTRLPPLSFVPLPSMRKHGRFGSTVLLHSAAPGKESHATGCRAVMLTVKSLSCQPGTHNAVAPHGFAVPIKSALQMVDGEFEQWLL